MIKGCELVKKIKKYHTNFDENLVLKAYDFASKAHSKQTRSSGDPYFSHPISVAKILIDLKLDSTSIITALLHDTVEDTEVTLSDIKKNFGDKIANLVDGVTKLTKIESLSPNKKAAENFRKLVMAMSQDIRVLLVKLADRLHNMRTINYIKSTEKRVRIANESLSIYAPLAARIGMYQIRDELQELSFAQINPEARDYISEKLSELKERKKNIVKKIIKELKGKISPVIKDFEIYGREKKPYSIWMKMKNKNVGFHHLYDIMAFRIIVKDIPTCYQMLGIINYNYNMIPNTFEDYISTPKENGYQSLHTTVVGPSSKKIEVQIRTNKMHEIAELGVAAHWRYKQDDKDSESEQYRWIRELISLFEHSTEPSEVLQNHKIQMHDDQVFCFTPTGDIFNLPIGSTVIDFAYAIHSEIGNKCVGAKANDAIVPLRKKLDNGDQIEIITDKNTKPSPSWLQFAFTSKAKAAIRHFIRNEKYNEYNNLGKAIIKKLFASEKLEINDELLSNILPKFNKKSISDLYVFVAEGLIPKEDILKAVYPNHSKKDNSVKQQTKRQKNKHSIPIDGLIPGMAIHFAGCCHPIPGDNIIGVMNVGTGITIHNQSCPNLKAIAINPQKLVDVCWKNHEEIGNELYPSRIRIVVKNKSGSLADISNIIAGKEVNITDIKITNRSTDFFELIVDIEVKNVDHLEDIISTLRISDKIMEVGVD